MLPIGMSETVTSVIPISSFNDTESQLLLMTSRGYVKRTPLKAFSKISRRGLTIMRLREDDKLRWARLCKSNDDLLIATR